MTANSRLHPEASEAHGLRGSLARQCRKRLRVFGEMAMLPNWIFVYIVRAAWKVLAPCIRSQKHAVGHNLYILLCVELERCIHNKLAGHVEQPSTRQTRNSKTQQTLLTHLPRNSTRPMRLAFGLGSRNSVIRTVSDILDSRLPLFTRYKFIWRALWRHSRPGIADVLHANISSR